MNNKENKLETGFRFPTNLFARIYAVDSENRRAVILIRKGDILELGILHEEDSGQLKSIAKTVVSAIFDEDGKLTGFDDISKRSVSCGTLTASFRIDSEGFIELMITHHENGELITEMFTS